MFTEEVTIIRDELCWHTCGLTIELGRTGIFSSILPVPHVQFRSHWVIRTGEHGRLEDV